MTLTYRFSASTLSHHVLSIVVAGADEKMIRVDARRVVAAVQDAQPFGNRTNASFVRYAMRKFLLVTEPHGSITQSVSGGSPLDTAVLGDFGTGDKGMMDFSHLSVSAFRWLGLGQAVRCLSKSAL